MTCPELDSWASVKLHRDCTEDRIALAIGPVGPLPDRAHHWVSWKMVPKLVRQWFVAFLVGYSSPSFAQPQPGVSVSPRAAASVTVQTSCEAMLPAYCQGKYGFHVMENGEWRAGPDPSGRSFSGRLSKKENRALWEAAELLLGSSARQPVECRERGAIPGVRESVTVRIEEREVTLQGAGGELNPLCPPEHMPATKLFARADELMRRYYPRPFRGD